MSGTQKLSAGDWTRLKRIQGGRHLPVIPDTISATVPVGAPSDNGSTTKALVLACIDPRFISALESYLVQKLVSPGYTYDLFILAGASLGGNIDNNVQTCGLASVSWQEVLNEHIQVAIALHNISEIWIFDHIGCAAYTTCAVDDSVGHNTQFGTLCLYLASAIFPPLTVKGYYIDNPSGNFIAMPPTDSLSPPVQEYIPPSTGAKVLVLGCIDPRFSAMLSSFLVNYKDVQFIYDLFILAGASLGANQSYLIYPSLRDATITGNYPAGISSPPNYLGVNWGPAFFDHLNIAISVHQITEVWVFDHLDCGAYKIIKALATDLDPSEHTPELIKLQGYIKTTQPALFYKGFIMDTNGGITKVVDDGNGVQFSMPKNFGSSLTRNPASNYTNSVLWRKTDYISRSEDDITNTRLCSCSSTSVETHCKTNS